MTRTPVLTMQALYGLAVGLGLIMVSLVLYWTTKKNIFLSIVPAIMLLTMIYVFGQIL